MSLVLKNLFIGSFSDAIDPLFLKQNNIKLIVNAAREIDIDYRQFGLDDIRVLKLNLDDIDSQILNINNSLNITIDIMKQYINENKGVLVHCRAGVSRSASVVIAYLMKYYNMSFKDAYSYLITKRPIVNPNTGFITQLMNFNP
jgi:predicted protein tyrosine phosphatase